MITRTRSFFTLLYVEGIYARLVYTWYKNIFHMIALLIVFLAVNGKKESDEKIAKLDRNETETRQCYC